MQRSLKLETEGSSVVIDCDGEDEELRKINNVNNNETNTITTVNNESDTNEIIDSVELESDNDDENCVNYDDDDEVKGDSNDGNPGVDCESEKRLTVMRQKFAVGGAETGSSSIEDRRMCCTNVALMVYKKAWEGARKALPRATRNRGNNNNPNLDDGSSSITTPTTFIDQRGQSTGRSDPNRVISFESEDDPATECSFEYEDDDNGDLKCSVEDNGKVNDRPTEDFVGNDSSNGGPGDVDLESFKRVYMTDVIPEEPDKESAAVQLETQLKDKLDDNSNMKDNSDASKWRRRFRLNERANEISDQQESSIEQNNNNNDETISKQDSTTDPQLISESDLDKPMSISDIERFVQVTCDQVMSKVREEGIGIGSDDDGSVRGSGIFKVRPGIKFEDSTDSRVSTDLTLSTIEIPTITITEDQLDDSSVIISEATLHETASEYEGGELPEDGGSTQSGLKGKATALKSKVKKLGSKVKDIFKRGNTPEASPASSPVGEYIDIEEEKRRRKEEEKEAEKRRKEEEAARKEEAERKRRDEELEKRALEMEKKAGAEIAKERERLKKEEAKRLKEEEKRKKEEEERLRKEEEKARKEEEKRMKIEEKKRREEEEKRKKEEEKMRKIREEEEKMRIREEEERKLAEEERKRQIQEEEEARKRWAIEDAEKRRRWIEEEAEKHRIKFEEEQERKRKQKQLEEEEQERKRIRQAEEEEERRRREEEQEERRRKKEKEEEEEKARETLKRKLEDEVKVKSVQHEDNENNLDQVTTTTVTVIESDQPYYEVDGTKDDIRRASSPSLASGQVSVAMSKSTSQATIMVTSPQGRRDKRSQSRDEETFGQAGESEGDIDPHMGGRKRKKMRKRLRDTKNKLINLKSKALESLPSMSSLKSRVKEILPVRGNNSGGQVSEGGQFNDEDPAYSIHREQKVFSEYRKRYPDSENEFFSDSELVESRKSTLKAMSPDLDGMPDGMYVDMDATADRVQMLLSPINSPLRPPRKSDYGGGGMGSSFHTSEPNISRTGTPKKPKRAPPPRPPPPEVDIYLVSSTMLNTSATGSTATSLGALEEIDLASSARDLSESFISTKKEPEKIPASIYYRKVVRDWQERHLKKMEHEMVSASSPNLETYQRPPRPGRQPPRIPPLPLTTDRPRPLPRRKLSRTGSLRQKMIEQQKNEENKENTFDGYETLGTKREFDHPPLPGNSGLPPLPPPRFRNDRRTPLSKSPYSTLHRRQLQLQQQQRLIQHDYLLTSDRANLATDGLYWKPFSWKTGRCRSLTELYVRKRTQPPQGPSSLKPSEIGSSEHSLSQEPLEQSLSYRLMSQYCSPPRPPPPTIKTESASDELLTNLISSIEDQRTTVEPLYSTIDRSKKLKRDIGLMVLEESNGGDTLIQNRPLPAPPLPPRSKRKNSCSRSRSNSPYLSLTNSSVDLNRPDATIIRPISPYPPLGMVDVSVETGSQLINPSPSKSKECQTSLEDIVVDKQSNLTNSDNNLRLIKDAKESQLTFENIEGYFEDIDGRESITPTPTTIAESAITKNQIAIKVTPEREVILIDDSKQPNDVSTKICQLKRTKLSSSSSSKDQSPPLVTANSVNDNNSVPKVVNQPSGQDSMGRLDDEGSNRTMTSYYDAEECDTDMDTFTDLDSISTETNATLTASSQFHSVYSEPLISSTTTTTSHYDTDEGDSKTMEIPCQPSIAAPLVPSKGKSEDENIGNEEMTQSSSSKTVPLVAEHVTIEEDSDDDMLQPRVASPSEMRAYISRRRMRPDSMDASDSEW